MNMKNSIMIQGSMEHIWKKIIDINHCVDSISSLIGVCTLDQPSERFDKFKWGGIKQIFSKNKNRGMSITHSESDYSYKTRAENTQTIYTSIMRVEQKGDLVEFTIEFTSESQCILSKIFSFFYTPIMKKNMFKFIQKDLETIKHRVEGLV